MVSEPNSEPRKTVASDRLEMSSKSRWALGSPHDRGGSLPARKKLWYDLPSMSSLTCPRGPSARTVPAPAYADWQAAWADAVRDPGELCRLLELPASLGVAAEQATGDFPLLVPRTYLSRIPRGHAEHPLLLQVLPRPSELRVCQSFTRDPVGEADATQEGGVLWKYRSRLLMVTTGVCAVHCRFCFRRHFPYPEAPAEPARWQTALERLAAEPSIQEVILSGGDPLSLEDAALAPLLEQLDAVPHLRRLRLHTRLPVMIPQRVTDRLLELLGRRRLTTVMVLHLNHPAEIDTPLAAALGRLAAAGIPLLQQGVLLRGVNDSLEVLAELYERLVELRVFPYYLHQLDRVAGAAEFEVPEEVGMRLVHALRQRLPGYAVPRYVRETPGAPSKTVLA